MVVLLLLQEVLLFDLLSSLVTSSCALSLLFVSPQIKLIHSGDAAEIYLTRKVFFPSGSVSAVLGSYPFIRFSSRRETEILFHLAVKYVSWNPQTLADQTNLGLNIWLLQNSTEVKGSPSYEHNLELWLLHFWTVKLSPCILSYKYFLLHYDSNTFLLLVKICIHPIGVTSSAWNLGRSQDTNNVLWEIVIYLYTGYTCFKKAYNAVFSFCHIPYSFHTIT